MKVMIKKVLLSLIERNASLLSNVALQTTQNAQYDEVVKRVFFALRPTMVLDVGGNQGQYHAHLRDKVGFNGPVCTFEPNPIMVAELRKKAKTGDNWHVFPIALGDQDDELEINITESGFLSSFLEPDDSKVALQGNRISHVEKVPVRRLDQMLDDLAEIGDTSRIFLKMDTQGYDLKVFAGVHAIMDRIAGIQSELSIVPIYKNMPSYHESLKTYDQAGFRPMAFSPVQMIDGKVIEFDCLMVRA